MPAPRGDRLTRLNQPRTLAEAIDLLARYEDDLVLARRQLDDARQELEDTNRGLIALYSELQAARQAESHLAAVVQSASDAIMSMTADGVIRTWNQGAERMLGFSAADVLGKPVESLIPAESQDRFGDALRRIRDDEDVKPYDTVWSRVDGTLVDVAVNVFALRDDTGELMGLSAILRDITGQVEVHRHLERMARFDTLTGLASRGEIVERLDAAIEYQAAHDAQLGVLFCDVDHFKAINDTWGHAVGDVVLCTVADRIRGCVRHGDTVGRMGGDELLVLLPGLRGIDEAVEIGDGIRRRAAEPITLDGHVIHVTLSIGATLATARESASTLTARADVAMYEAKRAGRNTVTRI